jgi:regulatory protein
MRAGSPRGDGLATVTYLPGVLTGQVAPVETQPAVAPSDRLLSDPSEPRTPEVEKRAAQRAERISMNALTRRGMSKREVERSLVARELDDETVAAELERLEGVGLIDDMALAQNLVGILQERKGLGRSSIAAELTRRLLAPAAIEYALELVETSDELGRAREIAVKRAAQLRSYDRETAVRRLSAFLMRRGYSGSTVRAAVEHALPATPSSRVRFQ